MSMLVFEQKTFSTIKMNMTYGTRYLNVITKRVLKTMNAMTKKKRMLSISKSNHLVF